jgi:hypothetical protein
VVGRTTAATAATTSTAAPATTRASTSASATRAVDLVPRAKSRAQAADQSASGARPSSLPGGSGEKGALAVVPARDRVGAEATCRQGSARWGAREPDGEPRSPLIRSRRGGG